MATTRYGVTGPMTAYGTFLPKAPAGAGSSAHRRGPSARGRARARGRHLWWLVFFVKGF